MNKKALFQSTQVIQNEIKGMTDQLNWPSTYSNLAAEKVNIGVHVLSFLNVILSGKLFSPLPTNKKYLLVKILYTISVIRKYTHLKVFSFPTTKMLRNNTKLLTMVDRLEHGISYSLIDEMEIENAYKVINQQIEGIIVPKKVQRKFIYYSCGRQHRSTGGDLDRYVRKFISRFLAIN